eukprot:PLAT9302.1.p1 GENE.PLAT9302.1~~PLAT9302.1.p1  ORF type:complete len:176 (+),score=83.88 PLAT9302.1:131-658(+)
MGASESVLSEKFSEKDLHKLYEGFRKVDADGSGGISEEELLNLPKLRINPLVRRLLAVMDTNRDHQISFDEFVSTLSVFTTGTKEEKLAFAFTIYDVDEDGYISNADLFTSLKTMVGAHLTDVQLQQLVDRTMVGADSDKDGLISLEEFSAMVSGDEVESKFTVLPDDIAAASLG